MKKKAKNALTGIRRKLDKLDDDILSLIMERGRLAEEVSRIKAEEDIHFFHPGREAEVLRRLCAKNKGPFSDENIRAIYTEIISASRSLETTLTVAYLGPEATYTHQAAVRYFGMSARFHPVQGIVDVFREVSNRNFDFGVVPVENSTEGAVLHTLDRLLTSDLLITSEFMMSISHCLLSASPLKKIRTVFSHPQALAQCRNWLDRNLPEAAVREVSSTVQGVRRALKTENAAAIAGEKASSIYSIPVCAKRIEDRADNHTRFLVLGNQLNRKSGSDKTSIAFSIRDRVGALYEMLVPFRKAKINLTKIESRPSRKKAWQYVFFVDFMGHIEDRKIKKALEELKKQTVFMKFLGSYPVSDGK